MNIKDRLLSQANVIGPGECWVKKTMRGVDRWGYWRLNTLGKTTKAHRIAYELFIGQIPSGMCVCHRCDNGSCINPSHLFLGTFGDNNRDRHSKGRDGFMPHSGEENGCAKLTEEQVRRIRESCRSGLSQAKTAVLFGVSQSNVWMIVSGKTWRSVR